MKKKRKNNSLFKLKKIFDFFSLALRPETKCHISRFFLWKKLSQCGRVCAAYARAGYSIIKMKKKREIISLFKLKKCFWYFSLALRPETKCQISKANIVKPRGAFAAEKFCIFSVALRPESKCHISRMNIVKPRGAFAAKKIRIFSLALRQETKCDISIMNIEKPRGAFAAKKFRIFSHGLRLESKCNISRLFHWKKPESMQLCARVGYSIIKMKKKRKNISSFKLKKKKIEFFSLPLRPETKCHISRFFHWKN